MNKLYRKSPLAFALVWIVAYVVLFSLADSLSAQIGTEKLITLPVSILLSAVLLLWIIRNGYAGTFGLHKLEIPAKRLLWYSPLVLMITTNLWGGIFLNLSVLETVLYMLSMVFVGLLEELIFRGLLFKAMARDNLKSAVIVSSVTFGIGHIVNLLNGAPFFDTLLQIIYAIAIGFLFTVLFLKTGSLIPCIVTHSVINALSAIAVDTGPVLDCISALFLTVVSLLYTWWILKKHAKTV